MLLSVGTEQKFVLPTLYGLIHNNIPNLDLTFQSMLCKQVATLLEHYVSFAKTIPWVVYSFARLASGTLRQAPEKFPFGLRSNDPKGSGIACYARTSILQG